MLKLTIKRSSVDKLLYPVLFFLIIFNPPFLPVLSFTIIFTLISIIYCIFCDKKALMILGSPYVYKWAGIFVVFYGYYFIISLISTFVAGTGSIVPIIAFFYSIIDVVSTFFVSFFLCRVIFKRGGTFQTLTDMIVYAGVMESMFGIAAFFRPDIKSLLNNITIANTRSEKIAAAVENAFFRNYGIASTLFDSFGFAMSIIALLALFKAVSGKSVHYIYFLMITFAACINTRTSMVLIAVGSAIIILGKGARNFKAVMGKIVFLLAAVALLVLAGYYLNSGDANAIWLSSGLDEIKNLFSGSHKLTGTFEYLYNEIYIPDHPIVLIFGSGLTPDQAIYKQSDIGYIQNLWRFGVMGSSILYGFYLYPMIKWYRKVSIEKILPMSIGVIFFLYLIKLNVFGYGIGSCVFMPLFIGILYSISTNNACLTER